MLSSTYGEAVFRERICHDWYQRLKNCNFDIEGRLGDGKKKMLEDSAFEALLAEDLFQTQEELAESLGETQRVISKRFKAMGMIKKKGKWVPYELKPRDGDFAACQWSVQCCKPDEKLIKNAEMGGLTPPAVLSRRCSFRLPFVSVDDTRRG